MSRPEFTEDRLAALYDRFYPPERREDLAFYLPLVLTARAVLDVGCGTGALLRMAREAGHTGRLYGLDPARGMLNVARRRIDIEWIQGDLSTCSQGGWNRAFDLVVMTGHAFQELIEDDDIRSALAAIQAVLSDGGRFAFEARNPLDRAWERWPAQYSGEVIDASGAPVTSTCQVELPVEGNIVRSVITYRSLAWEAPIVSRGALRFLDPTTLTSFLSNAGLTIDQQFGDWDRQPLAETSPEIITIARKA